MDIIVINKEFKMVGVIDTYKSLIWTDRYNEAGDFEIYTSVNMNILNMVKKGYYLLHPNSEHVMIVESILIETDVDEGELLTISGRSLESMLERRIVWNKTDFEIEADVYPNMQDSLEQLFNENAIQPAILARVIPGLVFKRSDDPVITSIGLVAQYHGEDLYSIVRNICSEHNLGFKITLNTANEFVFELYDGKIREHVCFSPAFDNVESTRYLESDKDLKNVALISSENDEVTNILVHEIGNTYNVGLDRREIFASASSISNDENTSTEQYLALMKQKGIDALMEHAQVQTFEGESVSDIIFVYGVDYFVGDTVNVEDKYGHKGQATITEFVISHDENGLNMYPTFISVTKGVYEYEQTD